MQPSENSGGTAGFGQVHVSRPGIFHNAERKPRDLAPAGSPTPEMVAGSLYQATAKPLYNNQSVNSVSMAAKSCCWHFTSACHNLELENSEWVDSMISNAGPGRAGTLASPGPAIIFILFRSLVSSSSPDYMRSRIPAPSRSSSRIPR